MTDREFKRLSRAELIEIIYQLQLREEELVAENERLKTELDDKRTRMYQVGNIAEAVLSVNRVMETAQKAADQYLEEIRTLRANTEAGCQRMLENAEKEAEFIRKKALENFSVDGHGMYTILDEHATRK